jgi:pimeloyl-ACP methyl ester carboxylesterase
MIMSRRPARLLRLATLILLAVTAACAGPSGESVSPVRTEQRYVALKGDTVKGVLHIPVTDPAPRVGILVMHEDANFLNHLACTEMSERGFAVMCVNGRADNNEALDRWNDLPLDAALGMRYLRETVKVERIVLFAHSGGGPLLSFYQAVAENGPAVCSDARKLAPCDTSLEGLPPADGMVFFDAHPGTAITLLRSLDASVVAEDDPAETDPALDPYSPVNGFRPRGSSKYSEAFKKRYFAAQAARMSRLVAMALDRRARMTAGTYPYPDDDVFYIPRAAAWLIRVDTSIEAATLKPRRFLRNDGRIEERIVGTVRRPDPGQAANNRTFDGGKLLTVHSFLGTRAVRATDSLNGIDILSNNNSTAANLRNIRVPILMMAAQAHYFIRDNEQMFEGAASPDKELIYIEGASHGIFPCTWCHQDKNAYSNAVANTFGHAKAWIDKRFAP